MVKEMEEIRVIIADDNKEMNEFLKNYLENREGIRILGCCYSDEEEVKMIEELKPDVVITDLIREGRPSGLEIIKRYKKRGMIPKFLVITAGTDDLIDIEIMDGYIRKPIVDYELVVKELRRI